jgi:hypothetical protein
LSFRQVLEQNGRNTFQTEQLCRFVTAMTGDNVSSLIDQDRRVEAERFDAPGNCPNLLCLMPARIGRVRIQPIQLKKLEL